MYPAERRRLDDIANDIVVRKRHGLQEEKEFIITAISGADVPWENQWYQTRNTETPS